VNKIVMRSSLVVVALAVLSGSASPARAQVEPERLRIDWTSGVLLQGELASTDFILDTSPFGGTRTERRGGWLDVDPALWFGFETTYRLSDHFSLSGSWMHSRSRFRVQYPALTSDEGTFDLEGLILAGDDFNNAGLDVNAVSAMSDAITDVYLGSLVWEVPILGRWAFPYASVGGGIYRIKSDGPVINTRYEDAEPATLEQLEVNDIDPALAGGLATFSVDATDFVVSVGGGFRASISQRWGCDLFFEDLIRIQADHSEVDSESPPVDPEAGRLLEMSFVGKSGQIHNFGVRLAINYAFWPRDRPR
jgi:hypothetical protein